MASLRATCGTAALLAIATAFVSPTVGRAAGPFDGNWVINAAGSGGRTPESGNGPSASRFPPRRRNISVKNTISAASYARRLHAHRRNRAQPDGALPHDRAPSEPGRKAHHAMAELQRYGEDQRQRAGCELEWPMRPSFCTGPASSIAHSSVDANPTPSTPSSLLVHRSTADRRRPLHPPPEGASSNRRLL